MVSSYESCVYFIYLNVQSIEMFKIDAFFEAKYWIQHGMEENITFYTNLHFYHEDFQHSLIKTVGVRYVPKNNNCKKYALNWVIVFKSLEQRRRHTKSICLTRGPE